MPKPQPKPRPDPAAFAEIKRDPATRADLESAVRQVMKHPANPIAKSQNREPTQAELNQRWKLPRVR